MEIKKVESLLVNERLDLYESCLSGTERTAMQVFMMGKPKEFSSLKSDAVIIRSEDASRVRVVKVVLA